MISLLVFFLLFYLCHSHMVSANQSSHDEQQRTNFVLKVLFRSPPFECFLKKKKKWWGGGACHTTLNAKARLCKILLWVLFCGNNHYIWRFFLLQYNVPDPFHSNQSIILMTSYFQSIIGVVNTTSGIQNAAANDSIKAATSGSGGALAAVKG